jgi:hypothetical protein
VTHTVAVTCMAAGKTHCHNSNMRSCGSDMHDGR